MVEIDLDFHRILCALTGNTALVRTWEGVAGSIRMSIMFAGTDRALANMSVPRHQQVVDAIATGDPHTARVAVDEHMREAAQNLLNRNQDRTPQRLTLDLPAGRLLGRAFRPLSPLSRRRDAGLLPDCGVRPPSPMAAFSRPSAFRK